MLLSVRGALSPDCLQASSTPGFLLLIQSSLQCCLLQYLGRGIHSISWSFRVCSLLERVQGLFQRILVGSSPQIHVVLAFILYYTYQMRMGKVRGAASPSSLPSSSSSCHGHSCALTDYITAWSCHFASPNLAGRDQPNFPAKLTQPCRRAIGSRCPTLWPTARPPPASANHGKMFLPAHRRFLLKSPSSAYDSQEGRLYSVRLTP